MFPMTITIHNEEQLGAVLNALSVSAKATVKIYPDSSTTATGKIAADTVESKPVKQAEKKAEAPAPAEESAETGKTYTLDDAKRLTTEVVKAGKRNEMVALLSKFGVQQAAKLPAESVTAFCTEAEALLS